MSFSGLHPTDLEDYHRVIGSFELAAQARSVLGCKADATGGNRTTQRLVRNPRKDL